MAIYTVFAPNVRDGEGQSGFDGDPMDAVFVKESFSWPAFFFAGPWLIYRRMWLVLLAYLVVALAVGVVGGRVGGPLPGVLIVMVHFLFALEANELRRWTLRRRGYGLIGIAEGRGVEEAEIRFFSQPGPTAAEPPTPPIAPVPPAPPSAPRKPFGLGPLEPSAEAGDVVGLFPAPSGSRP